MIADAIKEFVEEARGISIKEAALRVGLKFKQQGDEHPQPCPQSGGVDRFSFNTKNNVWVCRGCGAGGHDAIGMVAHCEDLDLRRRSELLDACSLVLGKHLPEGAEVENEQDRQARQERIAARRQANEEQNRTREGEALDFREAERRKARGIVSAAQPLQSLVGSAAHWYLNNRGCGIYQDRWLRFAPSLTYWHGQDDRGMPASLFSGPALIAPFLGQDLELIGCHQTWIDLDAGPKFRPVLFGLTRKGIEARRAEWCFGDRPPSRADLEAGFYEGLPTKKMRGTKKGGVIPIAGDPMAVRWVGGEGIENGAAFANWEGWRDDTFYFASGDLGNLAGPAEASSRFAHPSLTKPDKNGVERKVMIAGAVPRAGSADEAMWVGDWVREFVMLADGDSERVFTASTMARARARHSRPGRQVLNVWPRAGSDFSKMAQKAAEAL